MSQILYNATDNRLSLEQLQDSRDNSILAAATVTARLTDPATGLDVPGATWPMSMPAVVGKPGYYECILPLELQTTLNKVYTVTIFADAGFGRRRTFVETLTARTG